MALTQNSTPQTADNDLPALPGFETAEEQDATTGGLIHYFRGRLKSFFGGKQNAKTEGDDRAQPEKAINYEYPLEDANPEPEPEKVTFTINGANYLQALDAPLNWQKIQNAPKGSTVTTAFIYEPPNMPGKKVAMKITYAKKEEGKYVASVTDNEKEPMEPPTNIAVIYTPITKSASIKASGSGKTTVRDDVKGLYGEVLLPLLLRGTDSTENEVTQAATEEFVQHLIDDRAHRAKANATKKNAYGSYPQGKGSEAPSSVLGAVSSVALSRVNAGFITELDDSGVTLRADRLKEETAKVMYYVTLWSRARIGKRLTDYREKMKFYNQNKDEYARRQQPLQAPDAWDEALQVDWSYLVESLNGEPTYYEKAYVENKAWFEYPTTGTGLLKQLEEARETEKDGAGIQALDREIAYLEKVTN